MIARHTPALLLSALLLRLAFVVPIASAEHAAETCSGRDVTAQTPLALTYLYYWYDAESLQDGALTLHPPLGQPFDWRDPSWHAQQLRDMDEAGVDVALAVYWGSGLDWSREGLEHLVEAREAMVRAGEHPPAVGLFLDSNFLAALTPDDPSLPDLTTDADMSFMVDEIEKFFAIVPACDRLTVNGEPLIVLWRPDTEDGDVFIFDQDTLETLRDQVEERIGVARTSCASATGTSARRRRRHL